MCKKPEKGRTLTISRYDQLLNFKIMSTRAQQELANFIQDLPQRDGERPYTTGPVPHTQQDQFPNTDDFAEQLNQHILGFEGVSKGLSLISSCGPRAYFIDKSKLHNTPLQFLIENEFAHIHSHSSKSLHLVLPRALGLALEKKGWTENHPLAVANYIPETNFMLFGARNQEELEIYKKLLRVSYLYATKQWVSIQ
jgi:hypothetical protein